MKTIAQISDLHFGREDERVAEALARDLEELEPSLIVVSGDLTQRAHRSEFERARKFLERFRAPKLVVPGNHDIPLYNVIARFGSPLENYRELITQDLAPEYIDEEMVLIGINTARSSRFKSGRISLSEIERARRRLAANPRLFRAVVTHHPLIPGGGRELGRLRLVLLALDQGGVELVLSGHLHQGFTGDVKVYHPSLSRSIIFAQAGTAISTRGRGEPNAYNWITISQRGLEIMKREWDGQGFAASDCHRFARGKAA